ncbi:hypothetical protein [Vibrio parahaemolyticus]|uniref:hypothetical protein n=1 Tax=Vibrio parahaemolyticus TaxID=670 RepID=UPI002269B4C3|nr:hypothetical protein [Vibrio parahaemolyticus]MCX8789001.1 hypothetical protein [Vibrio parahaemolyticus]MCX8850075.1 hypothetical protein [Vibrio parahaemolyticus]
MEQKVLDLVNSGDELSIAIRCHLIVEHYLIQKIEQHLPLKNELNIASLNFRQKVELGVALKAIDKDMKGTFLAINKLRNQYAHDMDKCVTEKEVTELYSTLTSQSRLALAHTDYENYCSAGKLGGIMLMLYCYLTANAQEIA